MSKAGSCYSWAVPLSRASDTFSRRCRRPGGTQSSRLPAEIEEATPRDRLPPGLLVLPGGIDSHVHIAQPSRPQCRYGG